MINPIHHPGTVPYRRDGIPPAENVMASKRQGKAGTTGNTAGTTAGTAPLELVAYRRKAAVEETPAPAQPPSEVASEASAPERKGRTRKDAAAPEPVPVAAVLDTDQAEAAPKRRGRPRKTEAVEPTASPEKTAPADQHPQTPDSPGDEPSSDDAKTRPTIDCDHSQDLDDALWATREEKGIRLWVSITDLTGVSALQRGGALLLQALLRCNTVYAGTGVAMHMLPTAVEARHSLLPDQPNPVVTWEALVDDQGQILEERFYQARLTSQQRISYEQCDLMLRGEVDGPATTVLQLASLAAASLASIRTGIWGRANRGQFFDDEGNLCDGAYALIASLAIAYNGAAGRLLGDWCACYRSHDPADDPRFGELVRTWDGSRADLLPLIQYRMPKAEYSRYPKEHWALALPSYLRVTSPLRRVEDLINQQLLVARIRQQTTPPWDMHDVRDIVHRLNDAIAGEARREKKAGHRRRHGRQQALEAAAATSTLEETLTDLSANQLAGLLRNARRSGEAQPGLSAAIRSFVTSGRISSRHIAEVLAAGPLYSIELRQTVLSVVHPQSTDLHPVSVLNTLRTVADLTVTEEFEQGQADWQCHLLLEDQRISATGSGKAQARLAATQQQLLHFAERGELVSVA